MPQVAVAAIASGVGTYAATGYVVWSTVAINTFLAAVSYAMQQKAQRKLSNRDQSVTQLIRSPVSPHRVVYGEARISGTLVYATSKWETGRLYLHMVVALSGRELNSIGETYINDLPWSTTARYWRDVANSYIDTGKVVYKQSNAFDQVRQYDTIRLSNATVSGNNVTTRVTAVTTRIETPALGDPYTEVVVTVEAALTDEAIGVKVERSLITVSKNLGATDQVADSFLVAQVTAWTSAHRLRGRAYCYVKLEQSREAYPSGFPNIKFNVTGHSVYDPRTTTTVYSNNAAICALDYLRWEYGIGSPDAEIVMSTWIAAANSCDEQVDLGGGVFQDRYQCNGVFSLDQAPVEVLDQLCNAMAGQATWSLGQWRGYAGVATTTAGTISAGDFRAPIRYRNKPGRDERFNAVRGTFTNPDDQYQPTDFTPYTNTTYQTEDGGEVIWRDIDMPFTQDAIAAQRLAKIALETHRQGLVAEISIKLAAGLKLHVWEVVSITLSELGWTNKLFRVLDWQLSVGADMALGVDMVVQEYADAVYSWAFGEMTVLDLAPNTDLPDPTEVPTPTGLVLDSGTGQLFVTHDGTVVSRLRLDWTDPDSSAVIRTEVQYKQSSVTNWTEWNSVQSGENGLWISPVLDGVEYDVRTRHVNLFQVVSAWTESLNHTVIGKTAPPGDVATFLVERQPDGTREFTWTPVTDFDLAGYLIKAKLGTSHTWAQLETMHDGLLTASPWETNLLAAGEYTIGIKAVDTTGNESTNARMIISTLGDPRIKNAIVYISPHLLDWPGTKTNCELDSVGGALSSLPNYTWADLTTWAAWTAWATPSYTSIIYEHTEIDIGVIVPFVPLISVDASNTPTIEINYSTDGITYSGWVAPSGQITARYLKVRVTVAQAVSEIPQIYSMTIIASGDTIEEEITDSATSGWSGSAAAGRVVPIAKTYSHILTVQLALQSVGAGWTWEVLSKATTGPIVRIYNGSGVASDATVDVLVKGLPPV